MDSPVVLETEGLTRGTAVRDVSLKLRQGEVLGIAGLVGAGRTELARLIFGADRRDSGTIKVNGVRRWRRAVRAGPRCDGPRAEMIGRLDIVAADQDMPVRYLSGAISRRPCSASG